MDIKELARANIGALEAEEKTIDKFVETFESKGRGSVPAVISFRLAIVYTQLTYWKGILDD